MPKNVKAPRASEANNLGSRNTSIVNGQPENGQSLPLLRSLLIDADLEDDELNEISDLCSEAQVMSRRIAREEFERLAKIVSEDADSIDLMLLNRGLHRWSKEIDFEQPGMLLACVMHSFGLVNFGEGVADKRSDRRALERARKRLKAAGIAFVEDAADAQEGV